MKMLSEIKGVGESLRKEIASAYGSEERAIREINNLNLVPLLSIKSPGIQKIARQIYSERLGFKYAEIFGTKKVKEIHSECLSFVQREAVTEIGRSLLTLFYPTTSQKEILRRQEIVKRAVSLVDRLPVEEIRKNLKKLKLLQSKNPRIESQVIAVEDETLYSELSRKYSGIIDIVLIQSPEDLEFLADYTLVRYIEGELSLSSRAELPRVVSFSEFSEVAVLPEVVVNLLRENLETLKALKRIAELTNGVFEIMPSEEIAKVVNLLSQETRGKILEIARENFPDVMQKALDKANEEIEDRITREVSLSGKAVLNLLSQSDLPSEIMEIVESTAEKYENFIAEELNLKEESIIFSGIFSRGYPLVPEKEKIKEISEFLSTEAAKLTFRETQKIAMEVHTKIEKIRRSLEAAFELDFLLALGSFFRKYSCSLPEFSQNFGLGFINARHIRLAYLGDVQPVSYCLGESPLLKGCGSRATVITGANSGGKTTLLETIAQIQLLAQSGLCVPAERAIFTPLDKIFFFEKPKGSANAGALESLLRFFAEVAEEDAKCLILADELEAVTEPGAAARIISAFIEWFLDREVLMAVVTHLGEEVAQLLKGKVRVDGIEAKGLDENLNLIVDRNPVLGKIAKSTPELIVERLSRKSKKKFFRFLREKF